jgi:hypothetical protein
LNECLDCTAWGKITCDRRWKPTQPINKFEKQWEGDRNRSWLSIFNHLPLLDCHQHVRALSIETQKKLKFLFLFS